MSYYYTIPMPIMLDQELSSDDKLVYALIAEYMNLALADKNDLKKIGGSLDWSEAKTVKSINLLVKREFLNEEREKRQDQGDVKPIFKFMISIPSFLPYALEKVDKTETDIDQKVWDFTEKILALWGRGTGAKLVAVKSYYGQIKSRLKVFSEEDIELGIKKRIVEVNSNPFFGKGGDGENWYKDLNVVIRSDNKMEKAVNLKHDPEAVAIAKKNITSKHKFV